MSEKLHVIGYNLFNRERQQQIDYLNNSCADILLLQEASCEIIYLLDKYESCITKSHCEYTCLSINKKLFSKISIPKILLIKDGSILVHVTFKNTGEELVIGSLHLPWGNKDRNGPSQRKKMIRTIYECLHFNKLLNIPIILGGDTNMRDNENHVVGEYGFKDVFCETPKSNYITWPNKNRKCINKSDRIPDCTFRFDRFFVKNLDFSGFKTINNTVSDHLIIEVFIDYRYNEPNMVDDIVKFSKENYLFIDTIDESNRDYLIQSAIEKDLFIDDCKEFDLITKTSREQCMFTDEYEEPIFKTMKKIINNIDNFNDLVDIKNQLNENLKRRILLLNLFKKIEKKNVLIIDVETTGLNPTHDRIVEVAWKYIENFKFSKLKAGKIEKWIIKAEDFKIDNKSFHGISTEISKRDGTKLNRILEKYGLSEAITNSDYIIAHNAEFDIDFIINECKRLKFTKTIEELYKKINTDRILCTMKLTMNICGFTSPNGRIKYPSLIELHNFFTGSNPEKSHNAKSDVNSVINVLSCCK